MQYVFGESGIALPRTVDEQYDVGKRISKDELLPGDLVFYSTDGPGATFCGIYSGEGKFIYAGTKNGVIEGEAFGPYWDRAVLRCQKDPQLIIHKYCSNA